MTYSKLQCQLTPRLLNRLDASQNPNRQEHLLRLVEANALNSIEELTRLLKVSAPKLIDMPAEMLNGYLRGDDLSDLNFPNSVARGMGNQLSNTRVCPACIEEGRFSHPQFNLAFPIPCSLHQIMPIDTCPECSRKLSYRYRRSIGLCRCNFPLAKTPQIPAPDWFQSFCEKIIPFTFGKPVDVTDVETVAIFSNTANIVWMLSTKFPTPELNASIPRWLPLEQLLRMEPAMQNLESYLEVHANSVNEHATPKQRTWIRAAIDSQGSQLLSAAFKNFSIPIRMPAKFYKTMRHVSRWEVIPSKVAVSLDMAADICGGSGRWINAFWQTGWIASTTDERNSNPKFSEEQIRLLLMRLRSNTKICTKGTLPLIPLTAIVPDILDPHTGLRMVREEVVAVLMKIRSGSTSFYALSRVATMFDIFIDATLLENPRPRNQPSLHESGC